jgi:hypothetical protein
MATTRALEAVASAVAALLDDAAAQPAPVGFESLVDISVISPSEIGAIGDGAGVLPYRIEVNRNYPHRPDPVLNGGERQQLAVDLRFLVLVGAAETTTKLSLVGWIMRTLEDFPVLPLGLLNQDGEVFAQNESVTILVDEVPHEEILHLWEALARPRYDAIVLPYVATNIALESARGRRRGA